MEVVEGGRSKVYEIKIHNDQEPGMFWYHNHVHGVSKRPREDEMARTRHKILLHYRLHLFYLQANVYSYLSGLFGAIIVEGTDADIDKAPGIKGATEVVMLFSEYLDNLEAPGTPMPFFPIAYRFDWEGLTNGLLAQENNYPHRSGVSARESAPIHQWSE